jgi:hypothetical protein
MLNVLAVYLPINFNATVRCYEITGKYLHYLIKHWKGVEMVHNFRDWIVPFIIRKME